MAAMSTGTRFVRFLSSLIVLSSFMPLTGGCRQEEAAPPPPPPAAITAERGRPIGD
jgi:hypothetical protein